MCGIVGVIQYQSDVARTVRQRALRILFSAVMLETEVRGEDATGIYQVHEDGDWSMSKKGVKVSKWMYLKRSDDNDPVVYSDFMDSWVEHPRELTALVGHCRKATIGSRGFDNEDNHPFAVQVDDRNAILGVHNGTLHNHETIFRLLPSVLERQGKVDSEAIFHMLYHLSERGDKPFDGDMLKTVGHRLDGSYACIVVNTRFPNIVATFREARPIEFFMISPLNIVLIASDKKFIETALKQYDFYRNMLDPELPELSYYDQMLSERDYRIFDTSKEFPKGKPNFQSLSDISTKGEIRAFSEGVDPKWKSVTVSTTKSTTVTTSNRASSSTVSPAAQTSGSSSSPANTPRRAYKVSREDREAEVSDNDSVAVVEVEIGNEEKKAEQAFIRAKSLGLCPTFATPSEVGKSVDKTVGELSSLTIPQLANLVSRNTFVFGYAVGRYDSDAEVTDIRKKGRDQTKTLEQALEKKIRAQNHVWERNQLITIMMALAESRYAINARNVEVSLAAFPQLSEERRADIINAAKAILGDPNTRKAIKQLRKRYREAESRKKGGKRYFEG